MRGAASFEVAVDVDAHAVVVHSRGRILAVCGEGFGCAACDGRGDGAGRGCDTRGCELARGPDGSLEGVVSARQARRCGRRGGRLPVFTLTEARSVEVGVRRQETGADLYLEDAEGTVLHASTVQVDDGRRWRVLRRGRTARGCKRGRRARASPCFATVRARASPVRRARALARSATSRRAQARCRCPTMRGHLTRTRNSRRSSRESHAPRSQFAIRLRDRCVLAPAR